MLEQRYRVVKKLGQGGMGAVYRGEHLLTKRQVAIKVLLGAMATSPDVVARFQREAQAATAIGHPNIVEVLDMGRLPAGPLGGGSLYMVLEFLEGRDLNDVVEADGSLEISRAARVVIQLCEALHAAHEKGIVHRDVKPENVFLVRRGDEDDFVKVLDFGISKVSEGAGGHGMTQTGSILGTPYYLSPEQAHGKKDIDRRADIYAVGVLLFRILTGQFPFEADSFPLLIVKICTESPPSPRALRPELPAALEAVVLRCLEKKPDDRFATAKEVALALAPFAARTEHAGRVSTAEALARTAAHTGPLPGSVPATAAGTPATRVGEVPERASAAAPARAESAPPSPSPAPSSASGAAPGRSAMPLVAAGAIAVAVIAIAVVYASSSTPAPATPSTAPETTALVRIRVTTTPATATLTLDGEEVPNPYDAELPASREPHTLRASAPGYREATRIVAFGEARDLTLELLAEAATVAAPPPEPLPPAPEPPPPTRERGGRVTTERVADPPPPPPPEETTPEPEPEPEPEGAGHALKRIPLGGH